MVRGEVRAFNRRGSRGAGRDSELSEDIELAISLNTSHTAHMHGGVGHHYYHRNPTRHEEESPRPSHSREGGSFGADSEDAMVHKKDEDDTRNGSEA